MSDYNPPITPFRIVLDNWCFSIPIYQRLFVWEREQINRLLEDLWTAWQTKNENNETKPYYIGVITTVEQNNGKNGRVFSVIDGQQRLTFLLLFFCDCLARNINNENAQNFVFVNHGQGEQRLRINFIGRSDDEKDILNYINFKMHGNVNNLNFQKFRTCMDVFIKNHDIGNNQNEQFIHYVFENTSILVNELVGYSNSDLNLYFEKMNSTGRQLSPLDQLKGGFADHASDWNDCFNFETTRTRAKEERENNGNDGQNNVIVPQQEDFLNKIVYWNEEVVKEPAPSQESRAYSRLPMRPEVLALHVLRLTLNDNSVNLSPHHLLDSFQQLMLPKESEGRQKFMKNLIMYRDWIDNNIIYLRGEIEEDDNDDSDSFGLKYAFRNAQTPQEYPRMKMLQLQSMLYVSSGEKQEWILEAYIGCPKNENNEHCNLNFDSLRKQALTRWEKARNINELTYNPGMNRLAFWMLDYLLWEKIYEESSLQDTVSIQFCNDMELKMSKQQIAAIKNYRFTQNRSVEHLHPQNPPRESEQWQQDRKNDDIIRNSFGNLCMISQSENSSLSNEPVDVKFAKVRFALQGHPLQSIKLMLMFVQCNGKDSEWTPKMTMTHGQNMLKMLFFPDEQIQSWTSFLNGD